MSQSLLRTRADAGRGGSADRSETPARARPRWSAPLWTQGFRPFFFLTGLSGLLLPLVWVAMVQGGMRAPAWLAPTAWHAHEMVFGWVVAAIAGFLLTAVPVWTSTAAVSGRALSGLALLWVAGRVAMLAAGVLPPAVIAALDVAFLPALAACLARPLARSEQRRNWGFVPILLLLGSANAMMHAEALGIAGVHASVALRFSIAWIVLLIVVVGGRITPAFTRNAFVRRGIEPAIRTRPWIDRASVALAALLPAVELAVPRTHWSGVAELAAALAVGLRMCGWQTFRTGGDPLVWSLHAGYAWIAIGLGLVGVADLSGAVPSTAGLHALTAGAMGSMILAVMTRVSLGHTGRVPVAPRGVPFAYAMVHLGAVARVAASLQPELAMPALVVAATLWAGAFGLFLALYASILLGPRVDARRI